MKWIKWYSITCICIFIVVAFYMFIFPNKIETIDTSSAYSFVEKKVPNSAVYQGYKKNPVDGTTTIYYSYDNSTHIVRLSHPEDYSRKINWDKVSNIRFD
ncbi:TPA: hypothetical protein KN209_001061 [Clostridioides difficile]|uniref:DUF3139 domain-containing protein n=8 Tax=Clostridioides difficile TaxID=1496 RepID=F3Y642_CLOD6|nr:hypothetical protein [Clostridioides difficile]EQG60551.1 hypothetical protein QK5_1748 [Clostridioides difficile DA00149]EQK92066.1 hypothetical protein QEG_1894 [Clostridioides difficile CD127]OFT99733.1 hypothetical protein HMPREF3085_14540 [Clostridium sp. HMSC19E03]OFU08176.1 hypothetical protein HMPREF3081_11540 [Clostridium sp. HMSC19D02]OFU08475.1 hypothetical protein HMPREF3080_13665 [Clostridium sp. HMSC19C11]OFU11672.1 hypothetical protein HMPREF3079_18020 [Clostridium sp. HMSC1